MQPVVLPDRRGRQVQLVARAVQGESEVRGQLEERAGLEAQVVLALLD